MPDDPLPDEEAQRRTDEAIRASFTLAPKTHKEMAGHSNRPSRKASKHLKVGEEES